MDGNIRVEDSALLEVRQANRKVLEQTGLEINRKKQEFKSVLERAEKLLREVKRHKDIESEEVIKYNPDPFHRNPFKEFLLEEQMEIARRRLALLEELIRDIEQFISKVKQEQEEYTKNIDKVSREIILLVDTSDNLIQNLRISLAEYLESQSVAPSLQGESPGDFNSRVEEPKEIYLELSDVKKSLDEEKETRQEVKLFASETLDSLNDMYFNDRQGHQIGLRTWRIGERFYLRAYDLDQTTFPDSVSYGQAAQANLRLENFSDNSIRVRLENLETFGNYRKAGLTGPMLQKVELIGNLAGAKEVYGLIDSYPCSRFWIYQIKYGWEIRQNGGYYGEVYKKLG